MTVRVKKFLTVDDGKSICFHKLFTSTAVG